MTGVDLVEWQLRVAAGEALPLAQHELSLAATPSRCTEPQTTTTTPPPHLHLHLHLRPHSPTLTHPPSPTNPTPLQARIYAEHPEKGFLPGSGVVSHLRTPADEGDTYIGAAARGGAGTSGAVRVDLGLSEGDEVSVPYVPMLAKLITRGPRAILGAIHGAILTHCFGAIRLSGPTPLFRRCRPRRCAPPDGVGVGGVAGARNSGAIRAIRAQFSDANVLHCCRRRGCRTCPSSTASPPTRRSPPPTCTPPSSTSTRPPSSHRRRRRPPPSRRRRPSFTSAAPPTPSPPRSRRTRRLPTLRSRASAAASAAARARRRCSSRPSSRTAARRARRSRCASAASGAARATAEPWAFEVAVEPAAARVRRRRRRRRRRV